MLLSSGCVTQQWRCYWFRKMLRLPVLRHTAAVAVLTPATTLPWDQKNLRYPALRHVAVVALLTPATARSDRSIDSAHDRHTCSTNSYTSYPWRRRGGPKRVTRKTVRPSRDQDTTRSLDDTLSIPQPPMPPSLVSTGYNFGLKLLSWFIARPSFFPHGHCAVWDQL
ncbi:uncharacterized protein EI90DRAFT_2694051 [Cantharellus anzutake]|uniref:uncharacterized protein n=1 Tax=Cantharellus anzutake TaxID=1750568 RepID=UPI00190801CE|nr:uncharacterized protein EI90DRAFT_2694051 [Cantharellus anzutake]KAF8318860.1 hypothetical protein EI90DRAFT_2694051 [Cantharellus anzutake]